MMDGWVNGWMGGWVEARVPATMHFDLDPIAVLIRFVCTPEYISMRSCIDPRRRPERQTLLFRFLLERRRCG